MSAIENRRIGTFRGQEGDELVFDFVPPRPEPAVLSAKDFEGLVSQLTHGVPVVIFVEDGRPVRAAFLQ